MAIKKATKKFEAKHLKAVLDQRKEQKKAKQLFQKREKKRAKKSKDGEEDEDDEATKPAKAPEVEATDLQGMTVDDFLGGGFKDLIEGKKDGKKKRKRADKEDEDDDEAENETLKEAEEMEKELQQLADADPEFYKYLAENDKDLLDFKAAELENLSDIGDSDVDGDEEEEEEEEETPGKKGKKAEEVTKKHVEQWRKHMIEQKSMTAMRKVVLAFRAAAHVGDTDTNTTYKYSITSPEVYHDLLVLALEQIPVVLQEHIPIKESAAGKIRVSTDSKKYKSLLPLLKSHSASLLYFLPTLSDSGTIKIFLKSITSLLPYFLSFRKFIKTLLKEVVDVWALDSHDEATRITAFLVVRKAVIIGDEGLRESCMKALYSGFVKASRRTSSHTLPGINLMKNSGAELFGIDEKVGYTLGFGYIRQLAVHLRSSITNNSKDSFKMVYNWQYVHSLDFWSRVLSSYCSPLRAAETGKESALQPLIYPLVQVTLGAIRLIPTQQFFPLHFQLHRSLLRLSLSTGVYIPLLPTLLTPLTTTLFKGKTHPTTATPLDFSVTIRAPKQYLNTKTYLQGVADQTNELMAEFFVLYSKHISFPELAAPAIVALKRFFKKHNPKGKWVEQMKVLVQKLEANAAFIEQKRKTVTFAPSQRAEVDLFLKDFDWENTPLGAYVAGMRKMNEEKNKVLEEGRKADVKRRKEMEKEDAENAGDSDAHMDSEDEDEDEEDFESGSGDDEELSELEGDDDEEALTFGSDGEEDESE
ncbi:Noc2-domain-containing protein [Ascobolus immersus RN42]|uniref:Noc2-domain-containing protein n=1 Tax=Ascobolus immersus RN42 TaxID=1160509 RepID=A0A3N4HX99_ASCIM|nr:Noc2-domain-containing protein [Ascobolus immersus RN42]